MQLPPTEVGNGKTVTQIEELRAIFLPKNKKFNQRFSSWTKVVSILSSAVLMLIFEVSLDVDL